jgi:thiol:disulfide interchange protein DsbD
MYTGGILASFLVLAVVVIVLKISGELVGWGFQFQNPYFVIVLISIIFVFALALFDVFIITAPGMNIAAKASRQSGYLGSFLTGIFAVLVATPCTAPFLGAALGFAFTQPPSMILAILLIVGLGLALPFILLGIRPKIIQKIPKPGEWMNIFKEAMGFLLVGTAIYLMNTLYHQIGGSNLFRVIIFMGILAFASWIYGRFGKPGTAKVKQWISLAAAVLVVALGALFILQFEQPGKGETVVTEQHTQDGNWQEFSPGLIETLRQQGKPVFIDFHAQWCTTCKVNKATVLSSEEVQQVFEEYGVVPVSADYTTRDETIANWIRKYDKAGVPVYVLYVPGRQEPILFPELLTQKAVIDAVQNNITK